MAIDPVLYPQRPPFDATNPMPRYLQVRDWLAERIESGAITRGTKLPAEKDWAPALGVSQMTLNHAIQALVKDGLIVREVGRGTFVAEERSPSPSHIGLVLHWRKDSDGGHYGTHMLQGIYHVAANRPVRFSFAWGSQIESEPSDHYVRLATEMGVDGLLLLIPPAHGLLHILTLQEAGIPFVVAGASWDAYPLPCVDFDNAAGTRLAVRHLLALGHERIGLVNGALHLRSSLTRTRTFHRVLEEQDIAFDPAWEITSPTFTLDGDTARTLQTLLSDPHGPTAYFAAGYYLSMQTTEMVQSSGRRIPEDISVVGFGDPFTAAYMTPPLTTVRHPIEATGELAATRLLDDVAAGLPSSKTDILPVEFVERRSTAPPPNTETAGYPRTGAESARE